MNNKQRYSNKVKIFRASCSANYGMLRDMKRIIIYVFFMVCSTNIFAGSLELLYANEWAVPKSAATLLNMSGINHSMQLLQKDEKNNLVIRYPGGDEGTLWANELRSWLIALGLSSSRIDLIPGSADPDIIELEVFLSQIK